MTGITPTIEAVYNLINAVRKRNPGIPEDIIVIVSSGRSGRSMKHGHFAANTWSNGGHEILLGAESLSRGAVPTAGTVIHELAHAYAANNDIRDTSNAGRYHSTKFKEIGEKFGLELEKHDVIGWSLTTVPEATQELYAKEIEDLANAINIWRRDPGEMPEGSDPEKKKAKIRRMQCPQCEEPLLVTKKWWEKQGNGGGDYEYGAGLICREHEMEYEIFEEGGENG